MAFEFLYENLEEAIFDINMSENTIQIVCKIGYDLTDNSHYSLLSGIDIIVGGNEYYFTLLRVDENNEVTEFHDGLLTKPFFNNENRKKVLAMLAKMLMIMLNQFKPDYIIYVTFEPHLPDKAILKHELLLEIFKKYGYIIKRCDAYHGKRNWIIERR